MLWSSNEMIEILVNKESNDSNLLLINFKWLSDTKMVFKIFIWKELYRRKEVKTSFFLISYLTFCFMLFRFKMFMRLKAIFFFLVLFMYLLRKTYNNVFNCLFGWLCCLVACRTLVPWPGMESVFPAVESQNPGHLTTREFPEFLFYK